MKRPVQRVSQLVSTFGPGAMVDLPTRSVVIGGLERWEMDGAQTWRLISEPRLAQRLSDKLVTQGWLEAGKTLSLRTPPVDSGRPGQPPKGVQATVFPEWFVCKVIEKPATGQPANARRRLMVKWAQLDAIGGKQRYEHPDTRKKEDVTPLRFVGGCECGHLQDVDWRWVLHRGQACQKPMWLEERSSSGDPRDTSIVCACGQSMSLERSFIPGVLGRCEGKRPWLGDKVACSESLKLLTRTATNTYFSQTATVISLPVGDDALSKILAPYLPRLKTVDSEEKLRLVLDVFEEIRVAVQKYPVAEVWAKVEQIRAGLAADAALPMRQAEFDTLASGQPTIGVDTPDSLLHAETVPDVEWRHPARYDFGGIASVVAVHRLREVTCQFGFTRFEAPPPPTDGDLEEIMLTVRSAPLAVTTEWLPAVEQFGEGIFIRFDPAAIRVWLDRPAVMARALNLKAGFDAWLQAKQLPAHNGFAGAPYIMLHSLAHALMAEIALECGYPASAIKERIYALRDADPSRGRFGILLYTASAGSQGTLGGLIALAPRITSIIEQALDRLDICSNDPVCADHQPAETSDERALAGAACHSCLFVAETSCERRNQALDRALLVETVAGGGVGFFPRLIP